MNRDIHNLIGTITVELNLYDIDNNELSIEISNYNNDNLINRINNNLRYLDIIRNSNKIRIYEDIIKDNEMIIKDSVNRKKQDILEIAKYMISKEKEILYYKKQIDDLNNNIDIIQKTVHENIECTTKTNINNIQHTNVQHTNKTQETNFNIFKIIESNIDSYIDKKEIFKLNIINDNKDRLNLKYTNLNCFIEVKHNKNNIGKNDIKNYLNYVSESEYNCGICISMNSNYTANSNIKDFDILTIKNKPIIFISNYIKDCNKINYSIKLLHYVLNNKLNDDDSAEINTYVEYINKYYDILEYNIDTCDEKITKYNKKITKYENKIDSIKNKLNSINIQKNKYYDDIKSLDEMPTLQLSIVNKSFDNTNNTAITNDNTAIDNTNITIADGNSEATHNQKIQSKNNNCDGESVYSDNFINDNDSDIHENPISDSSNETDKEENLHSE